MAKHSRTWDDPGIPRVCWQSKEWLHPTIPTAIAKLAYEQYEHEYGSSQSFERLHERGGFGISEVITLLADLIERERDKPV